MKGPTSVLIYSYMSQAARVQQRLYTVKLWHPTELNVVSVWNDVLQAVAIRMYVGGYIHKINVLWYLWYIAHPLQVPTSVIYNNYV